MGNVVTVGKIKNRISILCWYLISNSLVDKLGNFFSGNVHTVDYAMNRIIYPSRFILIACSLAHLLGDTISPDWVGKPGHYQQVNFWYFGTMKHSFKNSWIYVSNFNNMWDCTISKLTIASEFGEFLLDKTWHFKMIKNNVKPKNYTPTGRS